MLKVWQVVMLISGRTAMARSAQRWKAGPWGGLTVPSSTQAACTQSASHFMNPI